MDRNLLSSQEYEIERLARKHGTTVEEVKEVVAQMKPPRSRRQIEEALDQHFQHDLAEQKEHAD